MEATKEKYGTMSLPPQAAMDPESRDIVLTDAIEALRIAEEEESESEDEEDLYG